MSNSTWLSDIELPPAHPSLSRDAEAEVVIIGEGLAGVLTGYLLSRAGKKVVILEEKDISNGRTAYTTAWLSCVIDTDLHKLIKMYTEEGAQKIWRSGMEAIDLIENIIAEEKIDCDFERVPYFHYASSDRDFRNLRKEQEAAQKIGFEMKLNDKRSLPFNNLGSLELAAQAKFHPLKFLLGLRRAMGKYGAIIYENTEAKNISGKNIIKVTTEGGVVRAGYCIIATYKPFNNPKELSAHEGMYLSYVIEANIPQGALKEGLYQDGNNPYHYFRIDSGEKNDRIILGGEDHRKEIPIKEEKSFRALENYLAKMLLGQKYEIVRRWRGGILETIDGLPYIGSYGNKYPNRLVATGFSGNGMTYSAVSAQILADIVLGRPNPYKELYSASRKTRLYNLMRKGLDFVGEFFGGAMKNLFN